MKRSILKFKIILCILIIIIILIIYLGFNLSFENSPKNRQITALEGRSLADKEVIDNYINFSLVTVRALDNVNEEGKSSKWLYYYRDINQTKELLVEVSKDDITITEDINPGPIQFPIINWTMDSTDVIELAKKEPIISNFLSMYNDATIESIYITRGINSSNPTVYIIRWYSPGEFDNPHNARIIINAQTGDILEVEL